MSLLEVAFLQVLGVGSGAVITSPPYLGMHTYVPDQWLRNWFLGGPSEPVYQTPEQLGHASPQSFANELRQVWCSVATVSSPNARLVVRFGGIHDRRANP